MGPGNVLKAIGRVTFCRGASPGRPDASSHTSATEALAQKGMGELSGVARQAVKPEVVSLTGKVTAVESGPCELTTGRASIGTHVMLETEDGESLNVHLGPQVAVAELAKRLKRGTALSVRAFRTDIAYPS